MEARSCRIAAETLRRSRALRRDMTDAERKLWYALRRKALHGARFRRQVAISNYIVDFCCLKPKLIIEVDGGQHSERQPYEQERTRFLESRGFRVLRLWDGEVLNNLDGAVEFIMGRWLSTPILTFPRNRMRGKGQSSQALRLGQSTSGVSRKL